MPVIAHKKLNILEVRDCLYDDTLDLLREELEENIFRNSKWTQHDFQEGPEGLIVDRSKVYSTRMATNVAAKLLTEKSIWNAVEDFRDYSWKAYYSTLAKKFEVALSRYPDGHFYRWHCDHYDSDLLYGQHQSMRVLNFVLFLSGNPGGELDISTEAVTERYLEEHGFNGFTPTISFSPKIGDIVIFPSYYVHQVRPTVGVREVMHGHVCL
jgi:Rps23 Pro-64 3,4-dihydroxylase Tpa1-like proline 4-hydroxylase